MERREAIKRDCKRGEEALMGMGGFHDKMVVDWWIEEKPGVRCK
jgi:hypothetical protein